VTHTLKWNKMHWVTVNALEKHWEEARIEADASGSGLSVKTKNITAFSVDKAQVKGSVTIDGQSIGDAAFVLRLVKPPSFRKVDGKWTLEPASSTVSAVPQPTKQPNLQGPIDDAFMSSFIMVKPTGQPLNAQSGQWAQAEMKEALFQWRRQFRGPAQVKDDGAISDEDIKSNNLILWGDPASNKVLAKIADKLPIKWTAKGVQVGDKTYDATKHAPVLIYPNPLNPSKYVVINCGFTFPQYSSGTNSQQTPKLPDWAVVDMSVPSGERIAGKGILDAAFFGEQWELTAVRK
jgi:hypothetical protein